MEEDEDMKVVKGMKAVESVDKAASVQESSKVDTMDEEQIRLGGATEKSSFISIFLKGASFHGETVYG